MKIGMLLLTMFAFLAGCGSSSAKGGFESDEVSSVNRIEIMEFDSVELAPETGTGFPKQYIIRKGDTLSQISRRFYGTSKLWPRIVEANPGLKPRELRIGQKITLPKIGN